MYLYTKLSDDMIQKRAIFTKITDASLTVKQKKNNNNEMLQLVCHEAMVANMQTYFLSSYPPLPTSIRDTKIYISGMYLQKERYEVGIDS